MNEVKKLISKLENEHRKSDSLALLPIMQRASGYEPSVSGSIVGFGQYHYKYASGREGDSAVTAFAPMRQNLVV